MDGSWSQLEFRNLLRVPTRRTDEIMSLASKTMPGFVTIVVALLTIPKVNAQPANNRFFLNINAGYQTSSTNFSETVKFTLFLEEGDFSADYLVESSPTYDVGAGVVLWKNLALAVGASRFTNQTDVPVSIRLPHPFFFNRDRKISSTAPSLVREETAVHLQALWMNPINDRFEIAVFGGPTLFIVSQDLVTNVSHTEEYPFDTSTVDTVTAERRSTSTVGFNVGFDLSYFLLRGTGGTKLGVGTLVRLSRASIDFVSKNTNILSVDAGGLHISAGVRLRF